MLYRTEPFSHQREYVESHGGKKAFALWWEPGTGKSKGVVDNTTLLYQAGEIGGLFLLAPNGLHRNFVTKEIPKHLPEEIADRASILYWQGDKAKTKAWQERVRTFLAGSGLRVLTMSYDGIMTDPGRALAKEFLTSVRCLYALDESQRIKELEAQRTKRVLASAAFAPYRRIMTGTPVANAPWNVWTQLKFLDSNFWKPHGLDSIEAMKATFAEWDKAARRVSIGEARKGLVVEARQTAAGFPPEPLRHHYEIKTNATGEFTGVCLHHIPRIAEDEDGRKCYRNLDRLRAIVAPIRQRVLKKDVLDLPPKITSTLEFDLNPAQRRCYDAMRNSGFVLLDGGRMASAGMGLTLVLRLQQIACGYLVCEPTAAGEEPEVVPLVPNPRLDFLLEITEGLNHPALIWARFRADIDQIVKALHVQGKAVARYDGAVSDEECAANEDAFHRGAVQFLVLNQAKGSEGLTLVEAQTVVYYSNSFKLLERLQSTDRPHRYGQTHNVHEIDLVARDTVDEKIIRTLHDNMDVADAVTGDRVREWLAA